MAHSPGYSIALDIPRDSTIERDRIGRTLVFLVLLAGLPILAAWFGNYVLGVFFGHIGSEIGRIAGTLAGGTAFVGLLPRLLVDNKGLTGFYTTNIRGNLVKYGPGLSIAYPWENREKRDTYPLEVDTLTFDVGLPTTTSRIIAKCELEWRYNVTRLDRATNLTEKTLTDGIEGFVDAAISAAVGPLKATQALAKVNDFNKILKRDFMTTNGKKVGGGTPSEFERKFGLDIITVYISHFEFPEDVQRARNAVAVAKSVHEIAIVLYEAEGDLDADLRSGKLDHARYVKLIEQALVIAGDAKLNIVNLGGADSLAKSLMAGFTAAGGV